MPGHWVGEEYECGRECREENGAWFWFAKICRLWQEEGEPEPEEKFLRWENTGEPCDP